jgi:hypothetical protein
MLKIATIGITATLVAGETLVEHEYGAKHNQMDDGYPYEPHPVVSRDDPTFAQGYFLKADAEGEANAKCLDGTPALYYHRKGWGTGANKWFLHQQGGGWCYDLESCVSRSKGSLGSTKADKPTSSLNGGYFSTDNVSNPLMWNWNAVELRYCDGASVSGDKATPTVVGSTTLHFRGRAILDAEINSILNDRGMKDATDVVVSGCSAGGLATFLHCDHWADAIGTATSNKAKVACMPDSGFFLDEDRSPKYGSNMRNVYNFQESSAAGLNAACVAAHTETKDPEKCIFAQWSSQHIKTPTFPLQSQYDSWQTGNVMGGGDADVQNEFGRNLTGLVKELLLAQPQHGIFLDSCHHHCGNWGDSLIDGVLSGPALNTWYNQGSANLPNKGFYNQDKPFPCNDCCVPTLPCANTEFCCPDAKACLTPTGVSCSKNANACSAGQICCPFTKECVTASHPCTPVRECSNTEFCCPDAKHCLKPVAPGTMCDPTDKSACPSPQVCCPLIKQCVTVGAACDPSFGAPVPAFMADM